MLLNTTADAPWMTDELLQSEIVEYFRARHLWCDSLAIEVAHGQVVISGRITSLAQQHLLLHLLRNFHGVRRVINRLRLVSAPAQATPQRAAETGLSGWFSRLRNGRVLSGAALVLAVVFFAWRPTSASPDVHPVRGQLRVAGEPAPGAFILFHPVDEARRGAATPSATVAADGTFQVSTFNRHDGAPAGEYIATVVWHREVARGGERERGPNVIPARFGKPETSSLRISVPPAGTELPVLEIPVLAPAR